MHACFLDLHLHKASAVVAPFISNEGQLLFHLLHPSIVLIVRELPMGSNEH